MFIFFFCGHYLRLLVFVYLKQREKCTGGNRCVIPPTHATEFWSCNFPVYVTPSLDRKFVARLIARPFQATNIVAFGDTSPRGWQNNTQNHLFLFWLCFAVRSTVPSALSVYECFSSLFLFSSFRLPMLPVILACTTLSLTHRRPKLLPIGVDHVLVRPSILTCFVSYFEVCAFKTMVKHTKGKR